MFNPLVGRVEMHQQEPASLLNASTNIKINIAEKLEVVRRDEE